MSAAPSIGICSWSLRPDSTDVLADALDRIGLDAVQLALVPLIEHPRQWSDAVPRLRTRGKRVVSGMMATIGEDYSTLESIARTGGFRPDETWKANLERALRLADLAADAGLSLVTVHAGFIPERADDPERGRMLDRIRIVADVFARRGAVLGLETGQERAETLADFLDALASPSVGINFDPANMILYGMGDPVEALSTLQRWVRQVHVKDAVPTDRPGTWGRETPIGEGAVDWDRFGQVLRSIRPAVDLVIEREAGERGADELRAAVALARSMLVR